MITLAILWLLAALVSFLWALVEMRREQKRNPLPTIRVVCNWYHAERFLQGNPFSNVTSHGICPECAERFRRESEEHFLSQLNPNIVHKI